MAKKPKRLKIPERGLHGYVADAIRLRGVRGLIAYHPANEGKRSERTGAFLKRMMMLPGVADFSLTLPGGRQHFLELKSTDGRLSPEQRAFRDLCEANGTPYAIVRSPEEADKVLEGWGVLRPAPSARQAMRVAA